MPAKLRQGSKHAEKNFLAEVQRFLGLAEKIEPELVDHALMVGDQSRTRLFVAVGALLRQGPIGTGRIRPCEDA